jgi:hypothetical protein
VLCETNILSLINQCLDNYYKIKTKLLQCSTVIRVPPNRASKRRPEYTPTRRDRELLGEFNPSEVGIHGRRAAC